MGEVLAFDRHNPKCRCPNCRCTVCHRKRPCRPEGQLTTADERFLAGIRRDLKKAGR